MIIKDRIKINKIIVLILPFIVLYTMVVMANNISINLDEPTYAYFATVGENDLYISKNNEIFAFKDNNIIECGKYRHKANTNFFYDDRQKAIIDKDDNLYFDELLRDENNKLNYTLVKIDKNLNKYIISKDVNSYAIANGILYFSENQIPGIMKYENNKIEVLFNDTNKKYMVDNNDDKSILIIERTSEMKSFLYNGDSLKDYDGDVTYIKKKSNKKPKLTEKIQNYKKATISNTNKTKKMSKKDYPDYLTFDKEERPIEYYFEGEKITDTLVLFEGNIRSNIPMCYSDTVAYYFNSNGSASYLGKIGFTDKFETDGGYRITRDNDKVYKELNNQSSLNNYQIYCNNLLFGRYEQNDIFDNKEQIKWIVLEENDDNILLLSKYILDYRHFDNDYLNNDFFNIAFDDNEKDKIISKDGKDKIFLIDEKSLLEYRDAYNKKHEKIYGVDLLSSIGTNYARHKGLPVSNNNDEYYYHGSYMIDNNKIVDYLGNIMDLDKSLNIDNFKCGIRPAIWVKKG